MYDFDSGNIYSVEVSSGFSIGFYGLFSDSPGYFLEFFHKLDCLASYLVSYNSVFPKRFKIPIASST